MNSINNNVKKALPAYLQNINIICLTLIQF